MASVSENSTEQIRYRRPRNQSISPSSDPQNPQISSLLQSTRCKPTISSFFLSTFINNNSSAMASNQVSSSASSSSLKTKKKKNNFSSASFRGFGCATSSQVSAPAVIRTSADWQAKKVRKKKQRKKNTHQHPISTLSNYTTTPSSSPSPVVVVPDVWCSPGIAFSTDAASVDCVVLRRAVVQGRGRSEGDMMTQRERSCILRRNADLEHIPIQDAPFLSETAQNETDVFEARHHRHIRHRSPGGLSEIMMFQSSLLFGGRLDGHDRYRDLRLDVDSMTYEELLELGDKIGYVSTGLREDEIFRCLRKTKHSILEALQSHFLAELNRKCSICQEEYEANDDMGKLVCGHSYHLGCIKQWLQQKNACPICKVAAMTQF